MQYKCCSAVPQETCDTMETECTAGFDSTSEVLEQHKVTCEDRKSVV